MATIVVADLIVLDLLQGRYGAKIFTCCLQGRFLRDMVNFIWNWLLYLIISVLVIRRVASILLFLLLLDRPIDLFHVSV